ncbi:MAG: 2-amino-4-hydroxy-6-hydroxymethyldihydropteridine diphosphokinase [Methylococcales symbiont of Hymedesmia sp. n. MRB-2018]|nr:MAG: 2-amino-4-hydroxy-6-hydroxymethyldihydropteridine diphosphokinase [Methylococcales symbiont of Hymedesmia sp. n. MRB-2018]KAF3984462.1 MAG: 2-amino-4-hydroxy-6-hydroxymethyldihydropteridine diphosphokinase [Methylococcales symbiont of Hymedesmia sp. n. MRB-2018]
MPIGFVSIGSNIDKEIHIPSSLLALKKEFGQLVISSLYETEAVGFEGDDFHNLIVQFDSNIPAKNVAKILRKIELENGRTRDSRKYAARTLDLDLILYGNQIISDGRLQIPRDEIEKYAFVLEPLAEIAPKLLHPISQIKYAVLWADYDKSNLMQRVISANLEI